MSEIRKVAFCPHCGNRSTQKLLHTQECSEKAWITSEGPSYGEEEEYTLTFYVAGCETCNKILLYTIFEELSDGTDFYDADLEYPKSGELDASVPKVVAEIYNEAYRIRQLAPNAFAVQIRRALEALCEDRGAKKGVLQKRLADLAAKGEIPSTLADVTDVLRLLGNFGAHAAEQSVKPWQVYTIDDFFRTVIEYVYVAPNKLAKFRKSLKSFESRIQSEPESDA